MRRRRSKQYENEDAVELQQVLEPYTNQQWSDEAADQDDQYAQNPEEDYPDAYLEGYDYRRAGHEVVCPMTYALSDTPFLMPGIHRLRDYLSRLVTENRFAALFEQEEKQLLFASYAEKKHTTTREMQANLYDVILCNALGAAILGKYPGILVLTDEEITYINEKLHRKTTRELEHMTTEAIRTLISDLHPEPAVSAYLMAHAKQFVGRLRTARDSGDASQIFVPSDPQMLFMQ